MKRFLIAVVALASAVANSEEVSDDRIKSMIIGSESYIDNSRAAERLYNNARRRCGDDTNRFARILCELAQTDDKHIADRMIYRLGWHGTPAQLPFLYTMATNEQHGATAVRSMSAERSLGIFLGAVMPFTPRTIQRRSWSLEQ